MLKFLGVKFYRVETHSRGEADDIAVGNVLKTGKSTMFDSKGIFNPY